MAVHDDRAVAEETNALPYQNSTTNGFGGSLELPERLDCWPLSIYLKKKHDLTVRLVYLYVLSLILNLKVWLCGSKTVKFSLEM